MTMASGSRHESHFSQARVFNVVPTLSTCGSALRSSKSKRGTPLKSPSSKRRGTRLMMRGSLPTLFCGGEHVCDAQLEVWIALGAELTAFVVLLDLPIPTTLGLAIHFD